MTWSRRSPGFAAIVLAIALAGACTGTDEPPNSTDQPPRSQAPVSPSESASPTLAQLAQQVEEELDTFDGIATGAIVLVRVGDRTRAVVSGMADVERRRRLQAEDRFPIQSITKSMVATTVLQLVEAEKLRLNDSVEAVVPGLLPQGDRITIQDLLSHCSGLHDPGREDVPPPHRMTEDSLIDATAADPLDFAPGTSGHYSNVGYEVLGRVVEEVTGKPLGEAMRHSVFAPAGMSDTQLLGSPTVQGYYDSKAVADPYLRFVPASGGVVSTAGDIDRFYAALWRGDLLGKRLVATP